DRQVGNRIGRNAEAHAEIRRSLRRATEHLRNRPTRRRLVSHHSLRLAKSQAHCRTNPALFKIRTDLHRSRTSSLEFPLDLGTIIVNIWVFHILMAPEGLPPAIVITVLELFLVFRYRAAFAGLVRV